MLLWCAGGVLALAIGATWWQVARTDYFWGNPLAAAQFQNVTDSGTEQAAALSRDGRFAAFLSERDGKLDVWVTQLGAGRSWCRGDHRRLLPASRRGLERRSDPSHAHLACPSCPIAARSRNRESDERTRQRTVPELFCGGCSVEPLPRGERRPRASDEFGAPRARTYLDRLCGAMGGVDLGRAGDPPCR